MSTFQDLHTYESHSPAQFQAVTLSPDSYFIHESALNLALFEWPYVRDQIQFVDAEMNKPLVWKDKLVW
jgi:hypothetical protein